MANCSCGAESHMDQVAKYPVGTKLELAIYGISEVEYHCDDGRAAINVDGTIHTFHNLDSWLIEILNSPAYLWTDERIEQFAHKQAFIYNGRQRCAEMCMKQMRDEYEKRIAELTK